MRQVKLSMGAVGSTVWAPVSYTATNFQIGLGATITSGASLTYSVQHTFDSLVGNGNPRPVVISRSTTVATVTDLDHRLSVADNIVVTGSGSPNLDGSYAVASIVDANTYTYTVANTGATASGMGTAVSSYRVFNHAVMVGQTGRLDGNYAFNIQAIRLTVTVWVSGKVDLMIVQGMDR